MNEQVPLLSLLPSRSNVLRAPWRPVVGFSAQTYKGAPTSPSEVTFASTELDTSISDWRGDTKGIGWDGTFGRSWRSLARDTWDLHRYASIGIFIQMSYHGE